MKSFTWFNSVAMIGYVVFAVSGVVTLNAIRQWSLTEMNSVESRDHWENWQEETVRQSSGEGPVQRRVAKSDEPPTLVLLRDHFSLIVGLLVVIGTLLYGLVAVMVKGAFLTPSVPIGEQLRLVSKLAPKPSQPSDSNSADSN